jgi:type III secretion protein S
MALVNLTELAGQALLLAVALSLPIVAAGALVSLVVATLQAATQIHDSTLAHLPRLLVVSAALLLAGKWLGSELVAFAVRAFTGAS